MRKGVYVERRHHTGNSYRYEVYKDKITGPVLLDSYKDLQKAYRRKTEEERKPKKKIAAPLTASVALLIFISVLILEASL